MKNKIREKIIASVMLSAFMVTNSMSATFAMSNYYGYDESRPAIRTGATASLDLRSDVDIPNGDSLVNLSLRDADITQVLRMFADQAGMNIIFAPGLEGTVTMDLVDISLKDALSLVVKTNNLYYDIKANTLVVSNASSAMNMSDRTNNLTIIPVKYVSAVALAQFINKSIFGKKDSVNPGVTNGSIAATNPATNELIITGNDNDIAIVRKVVEQFDKKPSVTTFKVNHITPAEMSSAICSSLFPSMSSVTGGAAGLPTGFASDESSSGGGGGGGSISVGGGKLACTLSSYEGSGGDDGNAIGSLPLLNLSVTYFPTLGTIQVLGGSDSQLDMIREYIAVNDKKAPQAYLEIQMITLNEDGSKTFDNTWQFLSKNFSFNAGNGQFGNHPLYPIFFAGRGFSILDPDSYDKESKTYEEVGYSTKYSGSPQLVYSVNYLIENNKGRVLANPRVLLTSGQTSTIDLTSDYVSKVTSQYLDNGSSSGSAQVQKEYDVKDDNGIKISVTPFISPDGYVTLDIKPEYKTISGQLYTTGDTGEQDLAVTLLQRRDLDLKGVRIKDGETLVIGGMIQEVESKTVKKIPFLGDIPVVGMFFRSTGTTKSKEEMVIMLTPQIVVDTEDAVAEDNML